MTDREIDLGMFCFFNNLLLRIFLSKWLVFIYLHKLVTTFCFSYQMFMIANKCCRNIHIKTFIVFETFFQKPVVFLFIVIGL